MQEIKKNIYWLGLKDWELREFHGHELSTHRGSTYNSYYIKDKKRVLIDTVWYPHKDEFNAILEKDIGGIENIDMIVINHSEPDHAGSLGYIMSIKPDIPIYCTKSGADILKKHFHKDWNFNIVKTGDTVNIGEYDLVFVEMRMIHWPDSMMTYVKGANVLFSNDAFGQHYSAQGLYNDEVDNCELYQEAIKYYANILTPMSPLIKKKIEEVKALNLPIDVIAPSHGVLWRDNPVQIIEKYYEWANEYHENSVVIIYDTMYDATKKLADAIGEGLGKNGVKYKLFNSAISDTSDLITEIFKAKGVIVGSCTVNNTVLGSIAVILEEIKAHKYKGKIGAGFGSYGWSGESPKIISNSLENAGIKVVLEPIKVEYQPTHEDIKKAIEFGENFSKHLE
ncbi:MAG TPA: flavodoxin domain-containing protein [Pseudobacteroides sp.]|nr:flavodoxin domain-containing protein [Pseudobacteroides sp.]